MNANATMLADVPALLTLVDAIRAETNAEVRAMLHAQLSRYCQQCELPVPKLAGMVTGGWVDPDPARAFWNVVQGLEAAGHRLNHAIHADQVAYNLREVRKIALARGYRWPATSALCRSLRGDPGFIADRPIHSVRDSTTVRCWVFRHPLDKGQHG